MKLENISTASLIPYARNSKTHSDAQVSAIAGSIREFGFNNPVLISDDLTIVAGHGRVLAAQKLGLDTVPCIRLSHLSDNQRRAYVIADNRLAEVGASWDLEMLQLEVKALIELDFDMELLAFTEADLTNLFLEKEEGTTDAYEEWQGMPEYEQEAVKPFKTIQVHIESEEALKELSDLLQQTITDKTKYINFPYKEQEDLKAISYVEE
jgi:ParB-like chromosome segregation protein Spo0J